MRTRARIDANQPEIVAAFRALGLDWVHTHQLGQGCPDGFAGWNQLWMAIEIKTEKGKLTAIQEREFSSMRSRPRIVRNLEDVIECANTLKAWHKYIVKGCT